jgi:hypothetical protein
VSANKKLLSMLGEWIAEGPSPEDVAFWDAWDAERARERALLELVYRVRAESGRDGLSDELRHDIDEWIRGGKQ